jgi:septum formation protein
MKKNSLLQPFDHLNGNFILASESPRRAQLLSLIGMRFQIMPSHFDESSIVETDPVQHVLRLSSAKAKNIAARINRGVVIGADTVVVLDGCMLGKPATPEQAFSMLRALSGRIHDVYTGFTLIQIPENRSVSDFEKTRVHFCDLTDREINAYIASTQPMDKAGAYGIQDQSAVFVDRIEGCFYNVVGFPLAKFYKICIEFLTQNKTGLP